MSMHEYIERALDDIVGDWEEFAGHLNPAAGHMDRQQLRDFAEELLKAIVTDMATPQSRSEAREKARGERPDHGPDLTRVARRHAAERLTEGFTLNQLIAEYRALRNAVVHRWRDRVDAVDAESLDAILRFDEAIDQALSESVGWYFERLEDARDLLNGVLAHDLRNPSAPFRFPSSSC